MTPDTSSDMPAGLPDGMALMALVREDYANHDRDWTRPGFRALAVHRFGVWRMGVTPRVLRGVLSVIYRFGFCHCRNVYGIELPYSVRVGRGVIIEHQGGIVIHGNTVIGDRCIIRQGVTMGIRSLEAPHEAPSLDAGVNVGAGACVLGAITIGEGASVGANSVVLHDVEPGDTVVGIPAASIRACRAND